MASFCVDFRGFKEGSESLKNDVDVIIVHSTSLPHNGGCSKRLQNFTILKAILKQYALHFCFQTLFLTGKSIKTVSKLNINELLRHSCVQDPLPLLLPVGINIPIPRIRARVQNAFLGVFYQCKTVRTPMKSHGSDFECI